MCFLLLKQKVMMKAPLFDHFRANKNFSGKSTYVSRSLLLWRISEKSNGQILRKVGFRNADRQANKHEFIGPPLPWIKKISKKLFSFP